MQMRYVMILNWICNFVWRKLIATGMMFPFTENRQFSEGGNLSFVHLN